jgi:hypothetical protein
MFLHCPSEYSYYLVGLVKYSASNQLLHRCHSPFSLLPPIPSSLFLMFALITNSQMNHNATPGEAGIGTCVATVSVGTNLFQIDDLSLSGCVSAEVYNYIGRDHNTGNPPSPRVFAIGSDIVAEGYWSRILLDSSLNPITTTPLSFPALAVVTDYETGVIYCLAHLDGYCITSPATTVSLLRIIDQITGEIDSNYSPISISVSIQLSPNMNILAR